MQITDDVIENIHVSVIHCQSSAKHGGVDVCHDLQFPQPWKCSSAVASVVNVTLPDGALRVQEHAAWSALNVSPCFRECVFHGLKS